MASIFNALPGLEVPVGEISGSLAGMWRDTAARGGAAPLSEDSKATQVNLVLHLGIRTTAADAAEQFQTVVRFSRRYPSRIVVLCPLTEQEDRGETALRAKIYGECHLGKSKHDTRCVEFVMLSYSIAARRHLESQVSTCLSTDLPLYYWAHNFSSSAKLADYQYLLSRAKRVLLDSAISPIDALTYPWPNPKNLRDLVYSRLLPVRQTIGQFLAGYAPERLADGLAQVTVTHGSDMEAGGRVLTSWFKRRLSDAGAKSVDYGIEIGEADKLAVAFAYADKAKSFRWQGDLETGHAVFRADFGSGPTEASASVGILSPENALSEAMFF